MFLRWTKSRYFGALEIFSTLSTQLPSKKAKQRIYVYCIVYFRYKIQSTLGKIIPLSYSQTKVKPSWHHHMTRQSTKMYFRPQNVQGRQPRSYAISKTALIWWGTSAVCRTWTSMTGDSGEELTYHEMRLVTARLGEYELDSGRMRRKIYRVNY